MRRTLVVLGTAAALGAAAPPALAHVEVRSTSPSQSGTAKPTLRSVTVTFTGPLRRGTLKVTGPDGRKVSVGTGGRDPRRITRLLAEIDGRLRTGRYTARWTIVAADGHDQSGTFRFRVR